MTVSTLLSRIFQPANTAIKRPLARVLAAMALVLSAAIAGPALAVTKTVNSISLDINMPQAQRGVPYSFQLAPTGRTAPYTFTILSGALPAAFTMSSSGLVTGVNCVSSNGSYNVAVRVTSADGNFADFTSNQAVSVNMTAGPASGCALTSGAVTSSGSSPKVGEYYSATITATGGSAPYTYTIATGALPTGLSLSSSGTISGTPTTPGSFDFQVKSADSVGNSGYTQYTMSVAVADTVLVSPSSLPTPVLAQAYSQTVTGSGGTSPYTFAVSSGGLPAGLSLNGSTGAITGTPTAAGVYSFTIRGTDAGSQTGTRVYSGTIAAALAFTTSTLPTPVLTQAYSQTVATSGGTAPVTFSVSAGTLPPGLSLNISTGAITGTPTASGAYSFTIEASDANSLTATQAFSGTITSGLAITTMNLPTPVLTQAYSQTIATVSGAAPVTFSISSGVLPAGLSIDTSTGVISGTPTAPGAYSFTIEASDATNATASQSYNGTIASGLAITTATLPTPLLNQAYSQTVASSGGTAPVSFSVSAGTLPTGLSLDTSTGAVTGTPTVSGLYSFIIQASDANNLAATQAYSGVVAGSLTITTATLPTPVLSQAYSQTVATSGGTGPVTFSVSGGSLPTGLSLNTSTGAITGTPVTSGAYSFMVQASDANGVTATQAYGGTIASGLAITTPTLPTPVLTQAYNQTVATSGGAAPITFSISAGSLPTGLSLNVSTGAITGTATAAGAYSFTVQALDANNIAATQAYSGTIVAALTITTNTLPAPVLTQLYGQTVATSGGVAPLSFSISSGSLPAGLSLNTATGAISGTPSASGAYSFTIRVLDANSVAATTTYGGAISAALSITTVTLPPPVLTLSYSQTVVTTGGTAPITFSVTAGALPAGLSLNASTGAITGTPTTPGGYSFTVQASDANGITAGRAYSGAISSSLAITTMTLPAPVLTQPYAQTIVTTGGSAPVNFSIIGGALPSGLNLNSSGVINGVVTVAGNYAFTIRAVDANSTVANQSYSGSVAAAPVIITTRLPTPAVNQPYQATVISTGGTAPVTFTITNGALPAGLSLDATTGTISGQPVAPGPYTFTVEASDVHGLTASRGFGDEIAPALAITTTSMSIPLLGQPYAQSITTTGGVAPVTFSVSGGALPAGLALDPGTGLIRGVVTTAGAYSFNIEARDSGGVTASQVFGGSIVSALAIMTTALPDAIIDERYSQSITTTGGVAPVTFSITSGALPTGLSLDSTGTISGAPTTAGGYSVTVQARDAHGALASHSFDGQVAAVLSVGDSALGTLTVGQTYSASVAASGGTGPYTFGISAGALPPGLTLNANGLISGSPTSIGTFSATVRITDARDVHATGTVTATVVAAVTADDQSIDVSFNTAKTVTLATLVSSDKVEVQTLPAHGQLIPTGGSVEYIPAQDYIGADAFTFIIKGAWGQSRLATVKLNVLPPPPPTAEPPPTKTIDTTETTGANGDAAVVIDKVGFNLAGLVKGIVTDVQIATHPQHGKVELVRSSAIAACGTGGRLCGQSTASSAPAITAVYTADKGYVGPDSFTFVAIGPGGVSAPARVNIEVVKTVPTAPVLKATAEAGRKATVNLTANASDGPFLAAALITTPAASIGTTRLIEGGTTTAHTYVMEFTSKGVFTGDLTFTYTLTNSSGVSAPLTVILTVKARPDPTTDASVRGVSDAQVEAARRFGGTQMDNFGRRLESLHGNQKGGSFGLSVNSAVGSADDCRLRAHTPDEERVCRERAVAKGGQSTASPGERRIGEVEVWTGGAVTVGRRDADTRLAKLTVQTSGVSGGADVRLTPAFTIGLGGGYASDATKLSGGKGRVDADGWTAATYASLHPRSGVFIDAVAGVGDLSFDIRRTDTSSGASIAGHRDASLRFGSVTAGLDGTAKAASWSLYLRAKALEASLGAYAEQGSSDALAYDKNRLNSLIGVVGGQVRFDLAFGEMRLTPRIRIEFSHEFGAVDQQRIHYAYWMDGASYELKGDAWASDRVTLGIGSGMVFDNNWSLDLDLGAELAKRQSSASARVGAAKRF